MDQGPYPRTAMRAVTVRQPCRVYYASVERQTCLVIDPETAAVRRMDRREFDRLLVLEHLCPPNVRKLAQRIPAYGAWKSQRLL